MLYCNLIGSECLKEGCKQYHDKIGSCRLDDRLGALLHRATTEFDRGRIMGYLESIRPQRREG